MPVRQRRVAKQPGSELRPPAHSPGRAPRQAPLAPVGGAGDLLALQRLAGNRVTTDYIRRQVTTTRETAVDDTPDALENDRSRYAGKLTGIWKVPGLRDDGAMAYKQGTSPGARYARGHRALVEGAGLSVNAYESNKVLAGKFPKGPGMTDAQYRVVQRFTRSRSGGRTWLSEVGLFTIDEAEQYLRDHKYQAWLRLDAANRILLAYIAWNRRNAIGLNVVEGTPAFRLGRSMEARHSTDDTTKQAAAQAIDDDIRQEWVATLEPVDQLDQDAQAGVAQGGVRSPTKKNKRVDGARVLATQTTATAVLEKVLLLLQFGLQVYDNGAAQHVDYEGSVARALSHGGRVTIRVPQVANAKDAHLLTQWLGVTSKSGKRTEKSGIFERAFGTHHQAIGKNSNQAGTGKFREQGGKGAALNSKMGSTRLYGLNLAVGGVGKKDFNGDVILPDGAHGHLLLVWRAPTLDRDGALQIGIETTGPGAKSTVGYTHNANSSEATANPESSFGGLKADKVGYGAPNTLGLMRTKKTADKGKSDEASNARLVDLTTVQGDWLTNLKALESAFQDFKADAEAVSDANEVLVGDRTSFMDAL